MKELGNIFLSWRKGSGSRRHVVGVLKRSRFEGVRFYYLSEGLDKAKEDGFSPYTEFPEISKVYKHKVLETFGQRLFKVERSDASQFLDFWEIEDRFKDDRYYLLAHTMGLTPTDNFEFLADYNPVKGLCFITDIAGLSHTRLDKTRVKIGEKLQVKFEPQNEFDPKSVAVYHENLKIGYIKKIHNLVFHKKRGSKLSLTVKAQEVNGIVRKLFVKASFD